jgi:hypothetical protein
MKNETDTAPCDNHLREDSMKAGLRHILETFMATSEELVDCLEHAALGKEWAAREVELKNRVKQLDKQAS